MKRFRRILFNGLAAMSLILFFCIAALCLYVHLNSNHYVAIGESEINSYYATYFAETLEDGIHLRRDQPNPLGRQEIDTRRHVPPIPPKREANLLGFSARMGGVTGMNPRRNAYEEHKEWLLLGTSIELLIPYWFVLAVTALLPVARFWHVARLRRLAGRIGCCTHCGYDVRATPDRCPGCGMISLPAKVNA